MKIGIIGCGYVGKAAALLWKKLEHQISATTRNPDRIPLLKSVADQIFLLNSRNFTHFIENQEVILISVAPDPTSDYRSTYLETAKQIAQEIKNGSSVRQILYTGSTSVYGDHGGGWVDENTPAQPIQEMGKILLETEQLLLGCSSKNLNICILRLGEIYGPGREIENRLRKMQGQSFSGTGNSFTNLIHLTDIVNALNFALEKHLQGIYNLCSDFHKCRKEFYEKLCSKEKLPPIQWDPNRSNPHQGNRRVSNQKIKNEGFFFTHPEYHNGD
jgi:nucleoside-diphosphate-sugar epimerase